MEIPLLAGIYRGSLGGQLNHLQFVARENVGEKRFVRIIRRLDIDNRHQLPSSLAKRYA